jgi:hypothetical protein
MKNCELEDKKFCKKSQNLAIRQGMEDVRNSKRQAITASIILYLKSDDYIRILREREGEREAER